MIKIFLTIIFGISSLLILHSSILLYMITARKRTFFPSSISCRGAVWSWNTNCLPRSGSSLCRRYSSIACVADYTVGFCCRSDCLWVYRWFVVRLGSARWRWTGQRCGSETGGPVATVGLGTLNAVSIPARVGRATPSNGLLHRASVASRATPCGGIILLHALRECPILPVSAQSRTASAGICRNRGRCRFGMSIPAPSCAVRAGVRLFVLICSSMLG